MSTALWRHDGTAWGALSPVGFQDEAALHELIEEAPNLLPLSGSPRLAVLGREVRLGSGLADLIAVEQSGRLAILEMKLAQNAEARRAVVAQILAYAAYLRGLELEAFERDVMGPHLAKRNYSNIGEAVAEIIQEHLFDQSTLEQNLRSSLAAGRFRLVLVLDSAPEELVQLVGYLEAVTIELAIDLVTITAYDIEGSRILVPQRIDPEHRPPPTTPATSVSPASTEGADAFLEAMEKEPPQIRESSLRIATWAARLQDAGLLRLKTILGKDSVTLAMHVKGHDAGLASLWRGRLYLYRSVFEKRAPNALPRIEELLASELRQGTVVPTISNEILEAVGVAYEEAATTPILAARSFDRDRVREILASVPPGYWISYADVAEAAGGSRGGALAVGQMLASSTDEPEGVHRVLLEGGLIANNWTGELGGPAECRAALEEEGLSFDSKGAADPGRRYKYAQAEEGASTS